MLGSILGALVPVALKLLESWLDKKKANKEAILRFYDFVKALEKEGDKSVKLSDSFESQVKKLKEELGWDKKN